MSPEVRPTVSAILTLGIVLVGWLARTCKVRGRRSVSPFFFLGAIFLVFPPAACRRHQTPSDCPIPARKPASDLAWRCMGGWQVRHGRQARYQEYGPDPGLGLELGVSGLGKTRQGMAWFWIYLVVLKVLYVSNALTFLILFPQHSSTLQLWSTDPTRGQRKVSFVPLLGAFLQLGY